MAQFLGISFYIWGGLCLVVALIFNFVLPKGRMPAEAGGVRYFILRWFHSVVWVLLGLSCLVRGAGGNGPADVIALISLGVYLAFLGAIFFGK